MNKIHILLFCLISITSTAQTENKSKILEIVGSAEISVAPDIGILNINVSEIDLQFDKSINRLNNKSKEISNDLKGLGFEDSAIRTKNFDVRKNTFYRNNKNIDSGYIAKQVIQLKFKNDEKNIGKILKQFSKSNSEFDLNFDFQLSDSLKDNIQKKIIKLATEDAFNKAKLISSTAKIILTEIKEINYGRNFDGEMLLLRKNNSLGYSTKRESSLLEGFTPTEITYSDKIRVIWNIK
ncbi:SIMPL domain-containing protein [Gramella sp. MAR_2010_147]|uniref:SIMPL domain-containing protein n=1 Tax=Gramella sp. MAR_2010_147 TaxID=1250205 RepID=UPI00087D74F0|nr:SIMPL domain-containing protein [Gramella sp. MAR_2010_147]SDR91871.1 Protein of unknown function [Gramella sp. MAR_2010_147]